MTLKLYLMGLIALVPHLDHHGTMNNLTIVLQQARMPAADQHFPVLLYPCDPTQNDPYCKPLDADQVSKDLNVSKNIGGDGWLHWKTKDRKDHTFGAKQLDGVVITIQGTFTGKLKATTNVRESRWWDDIMGAVPQNRDEVSDLSWVPDLLKIEGRSGILDQKCMISPSPEEIAAIVDLSSVTGKVSTFHLATICAKVSDEKYRSSACDTGYREYIPTLTFSRPGLDRRQAVADVVLIEIGIQKSDAFGLLLRRFGAKPNEFEKIVPKDSANGGTVEVLLGNLMPRQTEQDHEVHTHFDLYRHLSESPWQPDPESPLGGMTQRWVVADGINPEDLPPVLKVASLSSELSGGISRVVCMATVFGDSN